MRVSAAVCFGLALAVCPVEVDAQGYRVYALERAGVVGGTEDFGQITALAVAGGLAFVVDRLSDRHLAVIDPERGTVLARAGRSGEGPGEFQQPTSIVPVRPKEPAVWVHDFGNRRVTRWRYSEGSLRLEEEVPFRVQTSIEDPVRLRDGWVSAGLYADEAVLKFFSPDGRVLRGTGKPPFGREDMPLYAGLRLINRSTMAGAPSGERLAVGFYSANRIDVYKATGEHVVTTRGPREITARFHVADNRFFWDTGNELAYVKIAATDDRIFALFCGCALSEEGEAKLQDTVHVFDWSGRFRAELRLDSGVMDITVDDTGRILWGVVEDPWPRIVMWHIPADIS